MRPCYKPLLEVHPGSIDLGLSALNLTYSSFLLLRSPHHAVTVNSMGEKQM